MNVPYKPQYSAIEIMWGIAKRNFRDELTNKKVRGDEINLPKLVSQSLDRIHPDTLVRMGKLSFD